MNSTFLKSAAAAEEPDFQSISIDDPIPFGQQPIDYHSSQTDDPIARLNRALKEDELRPQFADPNGYLLWVLEQLEVPVESQLLVFSKTALNPRLVSPRNPRAIYFNDEIYVGWVPGAAALELGTIDSVKGGLFYVLRQSEEPAARFEREARCLACHVGNTTRQIPGFMVRSFLTDDQGKPIEGYSRITHATDFSKRFAGWYVSGTHGSLPHSGNVVGEEENARFKREPLFRGNVTDLTKRVDLSDYPVPHSDIVAHLVLHHQVHGQNLLIRVNYEHRLGRKSDAEDRLLRYLIFADEAPLAGPIRGTTRFAETFEQQGTVDAAGRSLRQFDLETRLFKYRLSYLIETRWFEALPSEVKQRLYERLWDGLTNGDPPEDFQHLDKEERRAIVEIVRAIKTDLPPAWTADSSPDSTTPPK